jgi:hypothetical protein
MKLEDFKRELRAEFGPMLENATPANVREFLDRLSEREFHGRLQPRIELNEPIGTYEGIVRDFFVRVLDMPPADAVILLWTMAFELSFSQLEGHLAPQLDALFKKET